MEPLFPSADAGLFATTLREELAAARLPLAKLRDTELRRLRQLLVRATQHVPYYREKFAAHRHWLPNISSPDELWRLPATSKDELLRAAPHGYIDEREQLDRLFRRSSSGSLGPVLHLYAAATEVTIHSALLWSGWMEHVTPQDRLFCLAAPQLEFQHQFVPNIFIPVQATTAETMDRFCDFAPTVILGSVEAIALLGRDLLRTNSSERRGVRLIFTFGQTLIPMLKAMIASAFDAEIFDLYGANEAIWLGLECPQHNGLHVPLGRVIVQIARLNQPDVPAAPGELGEVIVTSLARWTTPIIRYRLGDVATLENAPCSCGRETPRLRSLEGRIYDLLIATDGRWISPGAVHTDLSYNRDSILDYRIVQETREHVHVSIVAATNFDASDRRHIAAAIERHLGPVAVEIETVEQILREKSGKRRRVHRAFTIE